VAEFWRGERKGGIEIQVQREGCQPFLCNPFVLESVQTGWGKKRRVIPLRAEHA
jgi:hypothetical protein